MISENGFVFDLDGTLVDSYMAHYKSFNDAFKKSGIEFTEDDFRLLFGKLSKNIVGDFLAAKGVDADPACFADLKQDYFRKRYAGEVRAFPGVYNAVSRLAEAGYGISIASNSPRKNVELMLSASGLDKLFNTVVCVDEVANPKPDPEMLLKAADLLGLSSGRVFAVDDSLHGITACKKAGMHSIAVLTGGAKRQELEKLDADLIVEGVRDISPDRVLAFLGKKG